MGLRYSWPSGKITMLITTKPKWTFAVFQSLVNWFSWLPGRQCRQARGWTDLQINKFTLQSCVRGRGVNEQHIYKYVSTQVTLTSFNHHGSFPNHWLFIDVRFCPKSVLVFGYCRCMRVSLRLCIRAWPVQSWIIKFGPEVQNTLVKFDKDI